MYTAHAQARSQQRSISSGVVEARGVQIRARGYFLGGNTLCHPKRRSDPHGCNALTGLKWMMWDSPTGLALSRSRMSMPRS
jgi:hypothetical protein